MSWILTSLRRLRQGKLAFAGVALLVLVTAFLAAAGPRLFEAVTRQSIQGALADIPPSDRIVALTRLDGGRAAGGPATPIDLAGIDKDGADVRATFPSPIPDLIGPTTDVIETTGYRAVSGTALAAEMRLRIMTGSADHVRLVDGRAPTTAVGRAPDPLHSGQQPGGEPAVAEIPVIEAEISRVAADKLGLEVGSQVVMVPDVTLDTQAAGSAVAIRIVGLFEPSAAGDPFWVDDARVLGFTLHEYSLNLTFVQSTVLLAPESFQTLVGLLPAETSGLEHFAPSPRRVTWRFPAEPNRLDPDTLAPAIGALRRLETLYPSGDKAGASGVTLDSRLLGRLVALQGPWSAAGSVLSVAAVGAAAVALAALGLVIALTADERRRIVILQRERGASGVQSIVAIVVEGALVALPPALLGAWLAIAVVPGRDDGRSVAAALLVPGAAILLGLGLLIRSVLGPPRASGRVTTAVRGIRPRRLVFEALVVGLAIIGAKLLRDRGLGVGGGTVSAASGAIEPTAVGGAAGTDPFLTVVPVLVGIAAGLVALRLSPPPIAALARLAAAGRGLGPVLAARRAARAAGASRVLLIVLAIATLGAFASATLLHLRRTADLQAWQDVGAAFRVDAGGDRLGGTAVLPDTFDVRSTPGVDAAARAHLSNVQLSSGGQRELVAIDVPLLREVLAGTPVEPQLPAELGAAATPGAGTPAAPLPAMMSTGGSGPYRLAVGDTFQIALSSQAVSFRILAAVDRFPGIPATTSFIVASWPQIDAAAPHRLQGTTSVYVRAAGASIGRLADSVRAASPTAVLSDQSAEAARLAGQPVVGVVTGGVIALLAIALVYATLAVIASFVLAASSRALETTQLSTLGLGGGTASSMLLVEYGPPVLLATIGGTALGVALFAFLAPGLGFETILGVLQAAPPGLEPIQIALLGLGVAAILAIGVALGAPAQRRAASAAARRRLA